MALGAKKNTSNVHPMGTRAKANASGSGKGSFTTGRNRKDFQDGKTLMTESKGRQGGSKKYIGATIDTR